MSEKLYLLNQIGVLTYYTFSVKGYHENTFNFAANERVVQEQLDSFGEDIKDYEGVWGYSISETEERSPIFEYPEYDYSVTKQITNLEI